MELIWTPHCTCLRNRVDASDCTKILSLCRRLTEHVYRTGYRRVTVFEEDASLYMSKEQGILRFCVQQLELR
jgi:hypothetical protein